MNPRRSPLLLPLLLAAIALVLPAPAQGPVWVEQGSSGTRVMGQTAAGPVILRETDASVIDLAARAVPESATSAVSWTEIGADGTHPWYAISLDGRSFQEARPTSYVLKLRYAEFDPAITAPQMPAGLAASPINTTWVVQYWTQGLEIYRQRLAEFGAEVHLHLWYNANIVSLSPDAVAAVSALPFVRAVVPFHPAYKLDEQLLEEQRSGYAQYPTKRVNVLALRRGAAGQEPIAERILAIGGTIEAFSPGSFQMQATLNLPQIAELASMDAVQFIDLWAPPEPDMDIARTFHGATYIASVGGFDGTGVRGEVADVGTQASHPEFQLHPLIPHGNLTSGSHGTSTFGQIFASGVNPQALGLCWNGQGVAATWGNWSTGSRYGHSAELVNPNLNYKCLFQSNSGGSPLTTSYTTDSQDMDQILFDFTKLSVVHSQSNQGSQLSRAAAWSKNTLAVGGVSHENTLTKADDHWTSASIGPAADGRVKPELASFYDDTFTTTTTSTYTSSFGGTSGATPIVAGCLGLFMEMWHASLFGNPVGTTVFDSAPQSTTARAFLVAGATQWDWINGSSANSNIDRDKQGWGHPDLQTLYDYGFANKVYYVDETDVLTNFQTSTHPLTVNAGEPIFKATLVWRDNPGTVSSSKHLINDMNLKVTSPSGQVFWGNVGLTNHSLGAGGEALWSSPGGSPEDVNSMENVIVQNPQPGTWLVEVIAANLNQDNHIETPQLDADYALCVLGVVGTPSAFFNLQMTTTGIGDLNLSMLNVPQGTTEGYCIFGENATGPLGGGPIGGIYPTLITFGLLATPVQPGNLAHWTWPAPGLFPDVPLALPSGAIPLSFFPLDCLGVAFAPGQMAKLTPLRRAQ